MVTFTRSPPDVRPRNHDASSVGGRNDQCDETTWWGFLLRRQAPLRQSISIPADRYPARFRTGGGLEQHENLQPDLRPLLRGRGDQTLRRRADYRRGAADDRGSRLDE